MIDFERVGKYRVTGKLGQGSFGVVYKGRDAYLKRDVAIKVCSVEDEGLRKRFFREAEISGRLVHKNIVTVYEFGFQGDVPYLVQEMLSGEDLSRIVKRREAITSAVKLDYLQQVANGLGYAHTEGVIHRDIKPGNIRVLEDGRIKIMDFGIAKLASAETQLTQKGVTMGTASYLPPEQVRGAELDHRADIFSFAVLAYELLTFERPFKGNTLSALIYQILYKVPSPMSEIWPECPAPLSDLIAKCLEKKPERRFGSFAELIPELSAVRDDVLAGKWPVLQEAAAAPAPSRQPEDPSGVVSQTAIAETARGVLEGKVGDYTISTAVPPPEILRPSTDVGRSTRPIEVRTAAEPAEGGSRQTRILSAPAISAAGGAGAAPTGTAPPAPAPPGPPPSVSPVAKPANDIPRGDDSEELTLRAREIIDLVAEGKLEAEAAKDQLEATISRKDATAVTVLPEIPPTPTPVEAPAEPLPAPSIGARKARSREAADAEVGAPEPMPDAGASDTYRTVFRPPIGVLKWAGIAAAGVVLAGLGGWLALRNGSEAEIEPAPEQPPAPAVQPAVTEPELGAVRVHAAPWVRLTEITDAQGYLQELPQQVQTPLYLELPPGRYTLQVQNAEGTDVETCEVEVTLETVSSCAPAFAAPSALDYFKETGWWD